MKNMNSIKIEFAVQMECQKCVDSVRNALHKVEGIRNVQVSLDQNSVIIDTNLSHLKIQEIIENTGKKAVLKGYGEDNYSAVSMLGGNSGYSFGDVIRGVVRFVQIEKGCIIDGTIDGLTTGYHGLHIHECGDISNGCESVGEHYNPYHTPHGGPDDPPSKRHVGDLGNIMADNNGRVTFRMINDLVDVSSIFGRSLVVTSKMDDLGKGDDPASKIDGNSGKRLACGIIARSSGLFQNTKRICACDGLTLWDERDKSVIKQKRNKSALKMNNV
ncbi:PREDICTED: copper chaperone for superoxide dismutase [Ceratosolen solmsi marchali]|uniref:Extracellular superoxide dismutase [Cu-Zn] n=1 Tax=Ceratosolen solmsi marchali TaxID=326594 RepID=A0AAJ6YNB3_9HYME|nr:PREDICTED: copper chaperone for superoxide dismutase [Ceratosolen solmsi marchali]